MIEARRHNAAGACYGAVRVLPSDARAGPLSSLSPAPRHNGPSTSLDLQWPLAARSFVRRRLAAELAAATAGSYGARSKCGSNPSSPRTRWILIRIRLTAPNAISEFGFHARARAESSRPGQPYPRHVAVHASVRTHAFSCAKLADRAHIGRKPRFARRCVLSSPPTLSPSLRSYASILLPLPEEDRGCDYNRNHELAHHWALSMWLQGQRPSPVKSSPCLRRRPGRWRDATLRFRRCAASVLVGAGDSRPGCPGPDQEAQLQRARREDKRMDAEDVRNFSHARIVGQRARRAHFAPRPPPPRTPRRSLRSGNLQK